VAKASPAGNHPVGQAPAQRLGRLDGPAGQDHVQRPALADDARQPHRAAVDQRHAPASAEHPEDRAFRGHPQVAPQGQLQSAGHRVALDGGDHRLGQQPPRRPHRTLADRVVALALAGSGYGQVEPGAERPARPGQHGGRGFRIGLEGVEGGSQLQGGVGVHRVALFRAG
jgi:hypothetical protein